MMHIYMQNIPGMTSMTREASVPAMDSQAIEVFSKLNNTNNSMLGLIIKNLREVQIRPYNQFIWEIIFIDLKTEKNRKTFYSTQRVIQLIKKLAEKDPL